MGPEEKKLLEADTLLVKGDLDGAMKTLKELVTVGPQSLHFSTEQFNMQVLLLVRLQRIYKTSGKPVPVPLEKLVRYYEIVARNHPGKSIELSPDEAEICGRVLHWLPGITASADATTGGQLVETIRQLLTKNKNKYKLGVFYSKGF